MPTVARRAVVHGTVQGVGFRVATCREARLLGVLGSVRNAADGTVVVDAEGEAGAVETLLAWLRRGPTTAQVSGVDVTDATPSGATSFDVT